MSMGQALPPASFSEMVDNLHIPNQLIADYEPVEKQGIRLQPTPGTPAAAIEPAIAAILTAGDWIVTSLKDGQVLIEPRVTRAINVEPPGCVFHVTWRSNRAGIWKRGIEPKTGGNTRMQRTYPQRIFFALDLFAAFEFVEFQCKLPPQFRNGRLIRSFDQALMGQLDIWRVRLPEGLVLRRDVLFPGRAGWTDQPIPRRCISLVRWWRLMRIGWYFLRKVGVI